MKSSTRRAIVLSTAFAAAVWFAAPLDAQRASGQNGAQKGRSAGRSEPQGSNRGGGQAQTRSAPPQARPDAPRPQAQAPQQRPTQVQPPRQDPRAPAPRGNAVPRQAPSPRGDYRPQSDSRPQSGYQAPRYSNQRPGSYGNYNYGRAYVARRPVFVQPYYAFRPRVNIGIGFGFGSGFGLHMGYSVAYPFRYYDPYAFYNFRIGVAPTYWSAGNYSAYSNRVGGLSFDIDPYDAAVFIDGEFVGYAGDFSSGQMPLTLAAGRHRVELEAGGFSPMSFDITVVAGQVIPYRGTLPYYGR